MADYTSAAIAIADTEHVQRDSVPAAHFVPLSVLDNVDPVVTFVGPTTIAYDDPVEVEVEDASSFARLSVHAVFPGAERAEVVFEGLTIQPGYTGSADAITDGYSFTATRDAGWPEDVTIVVLARDDAGNEDTPAPEQVYTIDPLPEPDEPADVVPPTIGVVSPAPGTPITSSTALVLEVTDDSGIFRRILLAVAYASGDLAGVTEIAHDGDAFVGFYANGGSSRDPVAGGFRFTLLRDGGWPASPTLRVFAFDRGGNEV